MLALLLSIATSPVPVTPTPVAPVTNTAALQDSCLRAVEGDVAGGQICLSTIMTQAKAMQVDELSPDFRTSCLAIPEKDPEEIVWDYLDWLRERPEALSKPVQMTIDAALLEKMPCGWKAR